jgi:hypothetical protein
MIEVGKRLEVSGFFAELLMDFKAMKKEGCDSHSLVGTVSHSKKQNKA